MNSLIKIKSELDSLFRVMELEKDPGFSKFIPMVYESIKLQWENYFEEDFSRRFNGLMIRGAEEVSTVFLAVFPTDEVLERFIQESREGDLLFMHHPLFMECGDPRGNWGRGFVPIREDLLQRIINKRLSVYTCHAPMDYNEYIGTNMAIAEELDATIIDRFVPYANGMAGLICEINQTNTKQLIEKLQKIFEIPYVDFEGREHQEIQKIAVVAGCGDMVDEMKNASSMGVQAYITGEIHCHIDNEYGRYKYNMMRDYIKETSLSLIGVSHSASEYLVMRTQMKSWFSRNFPVNICLLPQHKWWL